MTKQKTNSKRKKLEERSFSEADSPLKESGTSLLLKVEEKIAAVIEDFEKNISSERHHNNNNERRNRNFEKKVLDLEEKIDDNEAYERRDTIIFSGTDIPTAQEAEDTVKVITNLVRDKIGVIMKKDDISVAHRLVPKKNAQGLDKRSIVVKLCRRDTKLDLMKACKAVKPKNIYINEILTRPRAFTLCGPRKVKKKFPSKVAGYGSYEGRVYAWVKPPNPTDPRARNGKMWINTCDQFKDFFDRVLNCDSTELVDNWPGV